MTPFDRSYTTFYQSSVVSIALSCTIFEIFDAEEYRYLEIKVMGHSPCVLMHHALRAHRSNLSFCCW